MGATLMQLMASHEIRKNAVIVRFAGEVDLAVGDAHDATAAPLATIR